jgi:hypothetical protein
LKTVVQVIWPMVNVRLSATAVELGMMTIWFAWEAIRTPLPSAPLLTKYGRQST